MEVWKEMGGRILWIRQSIFGVVLGGAIAGLFSCAKISTFDTPHMQESFMCAVAITPALKGLSAGGRYTGAVTVVGDDSGQRVTVYGLPTNEPFNLIPPSPLEAPANVAGFNAEVIDRETIKLTGFSQASSRADEMRVAVRGTIIRQGIRISTKEGEPIIISARAREIKEALKPIKSKITMSDGGSVDDIDNDEMIDMYEIKIRGDVVTIF